jgi:putative DNA primase/helicase
VFPVEGKRKPLVQWKRYQDVLPAAGDVELWWSQWPDANIAIALGPASNVVRVDADGDGSAAAMRELFGDLPPTAEFATPSGGRGWLFSVPVGFSAAETCVLWRGKGEHQEVRIQWLGAYTVVPPSAGYSWVQELEPAAMPLRLQDMLLARRAAKLLHEFDKQVPPSVLPPAEHVLHEAVQHLSQARCDSYDGWLHVGMALHSAGDQYLELWDSWSRSSCKYMDGECSRKWATFNRNGTISSRVLLYWAREDSGWRAPRQHEPLSDTGNGNTLARYAVGRVHYVREWDDWVVWDGSRWKERSELEVVEMAKYCVRDRYERACRSLGSITRVEDEDAKKRKLNSVKRVLAWCIASEDARHIHAAVDMAKSVPTVLRDASQFNVDPWLLNCVNGTLDLRTCELFPHSPESMLTKLCPTAYDDSAECPRWEQFLVEVLVDPELVSWMQRFLGYCLTGAVREHVIAIFHGGGRNGKTTLVNTVKNVLGDDYAGFTPPGFFAKSRGEVHPTKLVELYGKRFVADRETGDGMRLDEELAKLASGGEELKARRLYEDFWSFKPTHKLVLSTNHAPTVRGMDEAIWSRLRLVPFGVSFLGREDFALESTLASEASGVLRWMVAGCQEWQRRGLGAAASVQAATAAYRSDQDTVSEFVSQSFDRAAGSRVRADEVASMYIAWCRARNIAAVTARTFTSALGKLGWQRDDTRKYYLDVRKL